MTLALLTTYLTRLAEIHGRRRPRAYLEIGVCAGRSLALAGADTTAFGVDPDPQVTETLSAAAWDLPRHQRPDFR